MSNSPRPTQEDDRKSVASEGDRTPATQRRRRWSWRRRLGIALVVLLALAALAVLGGYHYNNTPRMSDEAFADALDQALDRGREWIAENQDELMGRERNIALFFMLLHMDKLHPTETFRAIVTEFRSASYPAASRYWMKLLDPAISVHKYKQKMNKDLGIHPLDNRWTIYALNPRDVELEPDDLEGLFDAERWGNYVLTHQLWTLWHLRRGGGDSRASEELLAEVCRRIAAENRADPRVVDLYYERVAFLMLPGHPEMVNRRWVERIIENQSSDGGWRDSWFGFASMSRWGFAAESNEHSTVLALTALYQARYAYPEHFGLAPSESLP